MKLFDKNRGVFFSDSLAYVNDYKVEEYKNEKGRTKKKIIYLGQWYCTKGESGSVRLKLILSAVLALIAIAALAIMLVQDHVAHVWMTVLLPIGLAMFPAFYLLMGITNLPFNLKPMDRAKYYHSFIRAMRSSVGMLAFAAVGEAAALVYRIVNKQWDFMRGETVTIVCFFTLAAALVGVIILLRSVDIDEKPNDTYSTEIK